MEFVFNKTVCQNLRRSLRKEWLETNSLGGYASSSLVCCNTRKYHGLLVVKIDDLPGRYVLLSTVEESLRIGDNEAAISCRKHPDVYYPRGHEFAYEVTLGNIPTFVYRYGDVYLTRQIMMLDTHNVTLVRYSLTCDESLNSCENMPPVTLRVKPLLAYRHMHALATANIDLQVKTWPATNGFCIRPYNALPPFYMQANADFIFHPSPDWYHNVEYMIEADRGFPNHEDLFQPGVMDIALERNQSVVFSAATEDVLEKLGPLDALWAAEQARREQKAMDDSKLPILERHLRHAAEPFLVNEKAIGHTIIAGYPWFEAWGRDTCIALSGITFAAGKEEWGWNILENLAKKSYNGQIPNMFSSDGNHAYNCIDASLWFVWAAQTAFASSPNAAKRFKEHCWPFIKELIANYAAGTIDHVHCDAEGFLHVGDATTQLTWMDANVNGKAVTPRHGCPVEINALWYNTLAFARTLAKHYGERHPHAFCHQRFLDKMRVTFKERFWVEQQHACYLADCWSPEGQDTSLRPNQLFAVGLPFPILEEDSWGDVVQSCRNSLLTSCGMRTLSPSDARYAPRYKGGPEQRDGAYHQGTVWPWPLGIYGDALLRAVWDTDSAVRELLETITPLVTAHLAEAGVGSISEIFMADPPHLPDGCIAQAWSVAEVLRLLVKLRSVAPDTVEAWEQAYMQPVVNLYF